MSGYRSTLVVLIAGAFAIALNNTAITVAVPVLMDTFGASAQAVQWVISAYMITMAAIIPTSGYISDLLGSTRAYTCALVLFGFGSLLGMAAVDLNMLILARVVQAAGGGIVIPLGMAIMTTAVPRSGRGFAFGMYGVAVMIGPAIGPTLSGYVLEYLTWRWVFALNLPIAAMAVVLSLCSLRQARSRTDTRFDWQGTLSIGAATISLMLALSGESVQPLLLVVSALAFVWFVLTELRHPCPALNLRVYKHRTYAVSSVTIVGTTIALYGSVFLLPILVQKGLGHGPAVAGLLMAPFALAVAVMMPISGKLFDRFGPRPVVPTGLALVAFALWRLGQIPAQANLGLLVGILIIMGLGIGLTLLSNMTAAMNTVTAELASRASAIIHVTRQIGAALSVVLLTRIFEARTVVHTLSGIDMPLFRGIRDTFSVMALLVVVMIPLAALIDKGDGGVGM